jgi:hypothetical protein
LLLSFFGGEDSVDVEAEKPKCHKRGSPLSHHNAVINAEVLTSIVRLRLNLHLTWRPSHRTKVQNDLPISYLSRTKFRLHIRRTPPPTTLTLSLLERVQLAIELSGHTSLGPMHADFPWTRSPYVFSSPLQLPKSARLPVWFVDSNLLFLEEGFLFVFKKKS